MGTCKQEQQQSRSQAWMKCDDFEDENNVKILMREI